MRPDPDGQLRGARVVLVNWRDPGHRHAGGSERYAWELATGLAHAGAHVQLLTSRDRGQGRRSRIDGIDVRRRGGRFTYYAWTAGRLLLARRRIDLLVDAENGIPSFAPLFVRRATPVVLVVHHVHLDQFGVHFPPGLARVGRILEGRVMPSVYRGARAVAVSESTRQDMIDRLGWMGDIEVVHNGAPSPRPPGQSVPGAVVVLGRLVAHKRVDRVVEAVSELRRSGRAISLDVVGRGPEQARLHELVDRHALRGHVRIHGYLSEQDKLAVLSRSRLHVCASDGEGWGQVVLEAAAAGVPTVARNVVGLRDSIIPGRTGWLLEQGDRLADGIAGALDELDEDARRRAMAAACSTWAARFTWDAMRSSFVAIARECLGDRAAG